MIDGLLPSEMINRETFLSLTSLSHLTHLSNFQGNVFILKYIQRTCWKRAPKVSHLPGAAWHLNAVIKGYRLISAASHLMQSTPLLDTWHKTLTAGSGLCRFVEIRAKKGSDDVQWRVSQKPPPASWLTLTPATARSMVQYSRMPF